MGNHVYAGHGHNKGFPICVDFVTGKVAWGGDIRNAGTRLGGGDVRRRAALLPLRERRRAAGRGEARRATSRRAPSPSRTSGTRAGRTSRSPTAGSTCASRTTSTATTSGRPGPPRPGGTDNTMTDASPSPRLTPVEWLICFVAALGFAFDIYELLMLPLIVGPALLELLGAKPGSPEFNQWVGWLFWLPAVAGGIFGLIGGYLTDLLRTTARARVEHPALRLLGAGRGLRDLGGLAAPLPLHHVRGRLRRVRGRGGVARGAVPRAPAARVRARLDPGLLLGRRPDGDGRLLPRRALRRVASRDPRGPRAVALHAHLRRHPRPAPDPDPAVPARVPGLAGEEGGRDPQEAQPGRALPGRPQEGHARHDAPLRVQLRGRLRRHPARAPHRARPRRGERPPSARPAEGGQRSPGLAGVRWPGRPDDPRLPGRARRVPPPAPAPLPGAGPPAPADRRSPGLRSRTSAPSSGGSSWSGS